MTKTRNRYIREEIYLDFHKEEPRIGNRTDALELLETMLVAEQITGTNVALRELYDAIERGIV